MYSDYPTTLGDVSTVLGSLAGLNSSLKLTRQFKGVELDQDVRLLEVHQDCAAFQATDLEMFTIPDGCLHLQSQELPKPVVAHLKEINAEKGILFLSRFAYQELAWKDRRYERVQLKSPTKVSLRWRHKVFRVSLENVSTHGMGLLASKDFDREAKIQPGANVRLSFKLAPDFEWADLKGKIVYLHLLGKVLVKIGIRFNLNVKQARLLDRYVAQRKEEILEELNQAYLKSREPRRVEDLIF